MIIILEFLPESIHQLRVFIQAKVKVEGVCDQKEGLSSLIIFKRRVPRSEKTHFSSWQRIDRIEWSPKENGTRLSIASNQLMM